MDIQVDVPKDFDSPASSETSEPAEEASLPTGTGTPKLLGEKCRGIFLEVKSAILRPFLIVRSIIRINSQYNKDRTWKDWYQGGKE